MVDLITFMALSKLHFSLETVLNSPLWCVQEQEQDFLLPEMSKVSVSFHTDDLAVCACFSDRKEKLFFAANF